jgi:hypothetical protein
MFLLSSIFRNFFLFLFSILRQNDGKANGFSRWRKLLPAEFFVFSPRFRMRLKIYLAFFSHVRRKNFQAALVAPQLEVVLPDTDCYILISQGNYTQESI